MKQYPRKIGNLILIPLATVTFGAVSSVESAAKVGQPIGNSDVVIRSRREDSEPGPISFVPTLDGVAGFQISGATGSTTMVAGYVVPGETVVEMVVLRPHEDPDFFTKEVVYILISGSNFVPEIQL